MKLITITGYKGGISKSVTAIHLAEYLSDKGRTLVIDGDPNKTAIAWSERGQLPFDVVDQRRAMKVLGGYDFAVIDTPARPDSSDLKELAEGCDLLVLPTIPDIVSLEPTLETAAKLTNATYSFLVSIIPPRPNRDGEAMRAELEAASVPVFKTMVRRSIGVSKAALAGTTVRRLPASDRAAWADFKKLGKEVIEILGNE